MPPEQLSPPLKLPQPAGAVAGFSDGIEVGTIAGGWDADTAPVPGGTVLLDTEDVVLDVELELVMTAVLLDVLDTTLVGGATELVDTAVPIEWLTEFPGS